MKTQTQTKPIIERIKTLKDIFKITKPDADELKLISYKGKNRRLLGAQALLIAEMIADVYNKGVKLDWDNIDQKKWFGWYEYSSTGSGFCSSYYCNWYACSGVSSRLHFKEEFLFWDAVKKFPKVYKNLMVK